MTEEYKIRTVFFGTPEFSVPFLNACFEDSELDVIAVVTQPDKPVGRKREIQASQIKKFALENSIPVLTPNSLKTEEAKQELADLNADLYVVVAYGKIIPQAILDLPKYGSTNVHPSLLPKYRGPSPIQWAISEGDKVTGVSIMLLDAGMDTGPILLQEEIKLSNQETTASLIEKIHTIGPNLLLRAIKGLISGEITPMSQNDENATITKLLKKEHGHIDWKLPAHEIDNRFRAYLGWPDSWSVWNRNEKAMQLKFHGLVLTERPAKQPGLVQLEEGRLFVHCSDVQIEIKNIQPEGRSAMDANVFIRGYSDIDGAILN